MDEAEKCLMNCEMFGRHAAYFESHIVPVWQEVYDSLASRAMISKGETALDVGTGTGEIAIRIGSLVGPRGSVVGIDLQNEMLAIARRKARSHGMRNLDFRQMSLEDMDLPDAHFDSVVGNYSLCCVSDYGAALKECFRVLRAGGRLTYNQGGPKDPVASQTAYEILEDFKPKNPSERLRALRESDEAQMQAVEKYRNPKVAAAALRKAGFHDVEVDVVPRRIGYPDAAGYVDRMLGFDWRIEVEEMEANDVARLREEAIRALSRLSSGPGFTIEDETAYLTGTKP